MSGKRDKGLSAEDRALWEQVARSAKPLSRDLPKAPRPKPAPRPSEASGPPEPADPGSDWRPAAFRIGESPRNAGKPGGEIPATPPLKMDKRSFQRMRRGKSRPDARIDLHGMTLAEAHPALTGFVLSRHARGDRLLLVITGKGRGGGGDGPIPTQRGILRRQVPHWLSAPPLASVVLQVDQAHDRHGGSGAFYVYLRRARQ